VIEKQAEELVMIEREKNKEVVEEISKKLKELIEGDPENPGGIRKKQYTKWCCLLYTFAFCSYMKDK